MAQMGPYKLDADRKVILVNRKAGHTYAILEAIEVGIALTGTEIKSVRMAHVNLSDAYVEIRADGFWLVNAHVAPYDPASRFNHDQLRPRRLLLHGSQIRKFGAKVKEKGCTLVPLVLYWSDSGHVKVWLGLCKGKHSFEKKDALVERDVNREQQRAVKAHGRGDDE